MLLRRAKPKTALLGAFLIIACGDLGTAEFADSWHAQVSGVLVDQTGTPIRGASISVFFPLIDIARGMRATGQTGEFGEVVRLPALSDQPRVTQLQGWLRFSKQSGADLHSDSILATIKFSAIATPSPENVIDLVLTIPPEP